MSLHLGDPRPHQLPFCAASQSVRESVGRPCRGRMTKREEEWSEKERGILRNEKPRKDSEAGRGLEVS